MAVIDWPVELDRFIGADFYLDTMTGGPGAGLDGRTQIIFRENRVWRSDIRVAALSPGLVPAYQTAVNRLRGRAGVMRMRVPNRFTLLAQAPGDVALGQVSYSDDAVFSDDAGFALPDMSDPVIVSDIPVGAVVVRLRGLLGVSLAHGARFSVDDFLYEVIENDAGQITFHPPARRAMFRGDVARVGVPTIRVRLADDATGRMGTEYLIGRGTTLLVTEAFER